MTAVGPLLRAVSGMLLMATGAVSGQNEPIPYKDAGMDTAAQSLDVLLLLGVLLGLGALGAAWYRRRLVDDGSIPSEKGQKIQVLARQKLSTRLTIHLVEVDETRVLVCETTDGVAIHELPSDSHEQANNS